MAANTHSLVSAALLPAMKTGGGSLDLDGSCCPRFLDQLQDIQALYQGWNSTLSETQIEVPSALQSGPTEGRVGLFFSGGVDSLYSLLNNNDDVTDLIFVHGFDIRLDDHQRREDASHAVHEVAAATGKQVIEVETNLRELLDRYVCWGALGHGPALATVAHLLSPVLSRILIASSGAGVDDPWGTHPQLDAHWSADGLEIEHDGHPATRLQKVEAIAQWEIALRTMRVCWENRGSNLNCGRCEKCLRTMIMLLCFDALSQCSTFPRKPDLRRVRTMRIDHDLLLVMTEQILAGLAEKNAHPELQQALRQAISRQRARPLQRLMMTLKDYCLPGRASTSRI